MSILDRFLKPDITKLKKNRDIKGLAKAVTHKDADVRRAAADALGKMRVKKAIDPLISALSDQDGYVRESAAMALGKIKDTRIREPLAKRLEDDWLEVCRHAAWSLIKIGAIDIVIEALKHPKEKVREVAAEALGGSNDMKAVVPLVEALKDENKHVRREAAEALKTFDAEEARELIRELKRPIYQVKNKSNIISRMIRRFKEPHDSEEDEYLAAVEALEQADSSIRTAVIDKVILSMIKTTRDYKGWRHRLGSIQVLEDLGPKVLPSIEKSWKQGKDDEIRWSAGTVFSWASAIHEKHGVPALIELLQDADAGIRNCADLYLGSTRVPVNPRNQLLLRVFRIARQNGLARKNSLISYYGFSRFLQISCMQGLYLPERSVNTYMKLMVAICRKRGR